MISVVILTCNNESTLPKTLQSTKSFKDVIVCDTGSTDNTIQIAKSFSNVRVIHKPLNGFGVLRNAVALEAKHDWILSLDSDEVLTSDLQKELFKLSLENQAVYEFSFHNFYNDKWIKWCGWYPEKHIRLYNRTKTQFSNAHVHEGVVSDKKQVIHCEGIIEHYSYENVREFLEKMQRYSDLFARQYQGKKKSSLFHAIYHGFFAFIKSYFLKRGVLGGKEGFVISVYNANTAFYKYLKLAEANQKCF